MAYGAFAESGLGPVASGSPAAGRLETSPARYSVPCTGQSDMDWIARDGQVDFPAQMGRSKDSPLSMSVFGCAAAALAVVASSSCIRSPSEVPPPGEGGIIAGRVVVPDPVSGTNVPAADIDVSIEALGLRRVTDEEGQFTLTRVPIGQWPIQLVQPRPFGADRIRSVGPIEIVFDGQTTDLPDLPLQDNGALQGAIRLLESGGGNAGGTLVVLSQTAFKAVTNDAGGYLFPQLPEGRFTIVAFRTGFAPGRVQVDVRPTTLQTVPDLELMPGELPTRQVSGVLLVPDSLDRSTVSVEFISEQADGVTRTATVRDDGTYVVDDVPVGVYTVVASAVDFVTVNVFGVAVLPEAIIGLGPVRLEPRPDGDLDGDGRPDEVDNDRDNDGCDNSFDGAPDDPTRCADTDGDGIDDLRDDDDDGDTLSDAEELSPGVDGFVTDPRRADTDDDGFRDDADLCPTVASTINDAALCTDSTPIGPAPVINSVRPLAAQVGEAIEVFGENFIAGPFTRVAFGGGTVAVPREVTGQRISVDVPAGALSGPVTVFNLGRVVTSTEMFTVRQPPEVLQFQPAQAAPGATVAVFGRGFEAPLQVSVGAVQATVVPCDGTVIPPMGLEAICFVVPANALSATVNVTTPVASATSMTTFFVLSGPQINALVPSVLPPGARLEIVGSGFGSGPVTVRFVGDVTATPTAVADTRIEVDVPAAAMTGPVTVEASTGTAESPDPLVVQPLIPAASRMFPTLVEIGDRVQIDGLNLAGANEVEFEGGIRAPVDAASTDAAVLVDVPVGARPGTVTVFFPDGDSTVVPDKLHLMTRRAVDLPSFFSAGIAYNPGRTELYVVADPDILTIDPDSLQVVDQRPVPSNLVTYSGLSWVATNEAGTRTVVAGGGRFVSVESGTFIQQSICEEGGQSKSSVFYNDAFYYTRLSSSYRMWRFDLNTGTCAEVLFGNSRFAYAGGGLVYTLDGNQGTLDIDPARSTFGEYVEPEIGQYPVSGASGWGFFGLQNDVFITGGNLVRAVRRDATDSGLIIERGQINIFPLQSTSRRWVVLANQSVSDIIVDTLTTKVAWRNGALGLSTQGLALANANGARFVMLRNTPTFAVVEVVIEEAP